MLKMRKKSVCCDGGGMGSSDMIIFIPGGQGIGKWEPVPFQFSQCDIQSETAEGVHPRKKKSLIIYAEVVLLLSSDKNDDGECIAGSACNQVVCVLLLSRHYYDNDYNQRSIFFERQGENNEKCLS